MFNIVKLGNPKRIYPSLKFEINGNKFFFLMDPFPDSKSLDHDFRHRRRVDRHCSPFIVDILTRESFYSSVVT